MAKLPAFQFYPADWLKDPDLRRCSHAAKGVWIDMLCVMHECEERGVLATAGKAWSDEEIASVVGGDRKATLSCIHELIEKQVARRRGAGAIYSARMTRDEAIRKARAAAGSEGGKQKASKAPSKTLAKGVAKSGSSSSSSSSDFGITPPTPSDSAEAEKSRHDAAAFFGDPPDECPHWITSPGENGEPINPIVLAVCDFFGMSPATVAPRHLQQAWKALQDAVTEAEFLSELARAKKDGVKWHTFIKRLWNLKPDDKASSTKVKPNEAKYARFHK